MTPDFCKGLIAGFDRVIANIQDRLTNGKPAPEAALELQMLAESIRLEIHEAERG